MASFLDKMKINTAITDHVKLDLSSQHVTTANFMQFNVAWSKELVPKEKIKIDMETFSRLEPLPVPTFGRANIHNRAFFVPFRTIFPAWNDFITDTRHSFNVLGSQAGVSKLVNQVPYITNAALTGAFISNGSDLAEQVSANQDFFYRSGSNELGYKFTPKGRQVYKQLLSLGYNMLWTNEAGVGDIKYSALPLMALAKVYCDWYWPSAYSGDETYNLVNGLFTFNSVQSLQADYDFSLNVPTLHAIFNVISEGVCYDSDYFVSAWDNPVVPNDGNWSGVTLGDISMASADNSSALSPADFYPQGVQQLPSGSEFVSPQTFSDTGAVSQYMLTALRSLTDYMKRHQLVGARALDRYLARFGVNLPAEKMNRSVYIGSSKQSLQFGDVMSQADTDGAVLGDYAGKGISYGDGSFEFDTDEYGIMLIVSSIVPTVGYYQGIDRNVMHIGKLDYYTPEFDNLGTQPISKTELFVPTQGGFSDAMFYADGVFGFAPRYAEYKVGRDRLTGDFRVPTIDAGASSWHLMREVGQDGDITNIVHDVNFIRGLDASQYSRIFYNTDADVSDKFKMIYNFNVVSQSPMKSLYDTYDFEDKGKKVLEDVNGVKMN